MGGIVGLFLKDPSLESDLGCLTEGMLATLSDRGPDARHHHQLHNTTREREWWQERKIDPLMIAGTLWRESQRRFPDSAQAAHKEPIHSLPQASSTESSAP
jgi:hypothetical protein